MKMGGFPDRTDKVTDTETKKTKAEAALCAADAIFRKMPYKMLSLNSLKYCIQKLKIALKYLCAGKWEVEYGIKQTCFHAASI